MKSSTTVAALAALTLGLLAPATAAAEWGFVQRIEFDRSELPENLYSLFTGTPAPSVLQYCLPSGYTTTKDYPLVVYVPGHHGRPGGNIRNAKEIAGDRECVVVSLPLFKARVDTTEVGRGLTVGFADYAVLSASYETMLERFYRAVPNIDRDRSAMVGYSNGALAVAVLVSTHDRYVLERFRSFCLVEHGMFHLTDLHKALARDRRYLLLVGDLGDYGRDQKIRAARLAAESFRMLDVDIECRIMEDTGHELTDAWMRKIGAWALE